MSTPNLADIYARITQLTQQAEPMESVPVAAGPTMSQSEDGSIEVEVEDGIITSFTVTDLDRDRAQQIQQVINQALEQNQREVIAEARRVSPSYARLMEVVDQTNADIQEAFRKAISQEMP
jgi:hypothetical protein